MEEEVVDGGGGGGGSREAFKNTAHSRSNGH